ncbi:MAG: metal ABC transporter ATP-binding protein [Rickettsiaceae bacterium H1]|nr:metal ABC transporter ATP-binding protein [Rickettsiaceae bacterium H1]
MEKNHIIEVKNLNFAFGKLKILENIDLNIRKGEIITIIGPNGSGKTSLLSILAGITPIKHECYKKKKGVTISYMPQKITFDKVLPITVKEFLYLTVNKNQINEIAEELNITKILDKQVYEISGGELQRVLLANCLLAKPQVMILDEPISSMDINSATLFYKLISDFRLRTGCSIVMASHDLYVVMKNTDRVICLNGKIQCEGKPNEIISHKKFINLFGENVAFYQHHHSK